MGCGGCFTLLKHLKPKEILKEANLPAELQDLIYVKKMALHAMKLFYSANYDPVCIYCASGDDVEPSSDPFYPQCADCKNKEKIYASKKI